MDVHVNMDCFFTILKFDLFLQPRIAVIFMKLKMGWLKNKLKNQRDKSLEVCILNLGIYVQKLDVDDETRPETRADLVYFIVPEWTYNIYYLPLSTLVLTGHPLQYEVALVEVITVLGEK